jgi:hypothetical protein
MRGAGAKMGHGLGIGGLAKCLYVQVRLIESVS